MPSGLAAFGRNPTRSRPRSASSLAGVFLLAAAMVALPASPARAASVDQVTIEGGGWGHGVGMSQYGAQGQALIDGRGYDQILQHYYKNAWVDDLSTVSPSSPIVEYNNSLWLGAIQGATSVDFVARGGSLTICHSGSNCPKAVEPQEDVVWTVRVKSPGVCVFEIDGDQQGQAGECWAGLTMVGNARIELPEIGKTFGHGKMRVRAVGDTETATSFHVSFSMDLEEYVSGIAEMPNSWHAEALKSQAVAARSYAVAKAHQRETGTRSGSGVNPAFSQAWKDICWCHVRATTADQAYQGWSQSQNPSWSAAVAATDDEIVTHANASFLEDGVASTFYSSSTSGVTDSNVGGFGSSTQYPYLKSVDDHWAVDPQVNNPYANWEVSVSSGAIITMLAETTKAWQVGFNSLSDAELLNGPPEALVRFTGKVGGNTESVDVPAWWLRSELGLRSPGITDVTTSSGQPHGAVWTQDTGSIKGSAETGDFFGRALAPGDFDGDGWADLAIAAPSDGIGPIGDAGLVNVIYGDGFGLSDAGNEHWYQDSTGVPNTSEIGDGFATSIASGDFNGDGFDDLAIGVPHEGLGGKANAGAVHVFWGTASGLDPSGELITQDSPGVPGIVEAGDRLGFAMTTGDFDGDGRVDLAVGAPGESIGSEASAGAVFVFPGSASGLNLSGASSLHQDTSGVPGGSESGDQFGSSLSAGDVDGDGKDDLAVGSPGEGIAGSQDSGAVHVFWGGASGLKGTRSDWVHQDSSGIKGKAESGDEFGSALAVGDLTGNLRDELAIGIPGEGVGGQSGAGRVLVIIGRSDRSLTHDRSIHQGTTGVSGAVEAGDSFGAALAIGEFRPGSHPHLVIGAPGEDVQSTSDAGLVHLVSGDSSGIDTSDEFSLRQDEVPGDQVVEQGDRFGSALAAADFDGDGAADLIVGSPDEDWGSIVDAGAIAVVDNFA